MKGVDGCTVIIILTAIILIYADTGTGLAI